MQKARAILSRAEKNLRQLIASAAEAGDYAAVEAVAAWASQLHGMHGIAVERAVDAATLPDSPPSMNRGKAADRESRKPAKGRKRAGAYPKFAREGESLVKIAWSKSQKSEYRHRSSKHVLSHVVGTLATLFVADDAVVRMEQLLPVTGPDGADLPDYHAYVCLAWLKSIGAVKPKGRQGYVRTGSSDAMKSLVDRSWSHLPRAG